MKSNRRMARQYLNETPLQNFWAVVHEAKITDNEQEVLDLRFIHGKTIGEIARMIHASPETVNRIIQRAYDKISKLI